MSPLHVIDLCTTDGLHAAEMPAIINQSVYSFQIPIQTMTFDIVALHGTWQSGKLATEAGPCAIFTTKKIPISRLDLQEISVETQIAQDPKTNQLRQT